MSEEVQLRAAQNVLFYSLLPRPSGNVALVARGLGRGPVQIRRWARRFGIDIEHFWSADHDPHDP